LKNDKTNLSRQLRHIEISILRGQIWQNDKNTLCRQLGYFHIGTLGVQIGQNLEQNYVVKYDILI